MPEKIALAKAMTPDKPPEQLIQVGQLDADFDPSPGDP